MIRASVLGATGYAGYELVRLFCGHEDVEIEMLASQSFCGKKMSDVYKNLKGICDKNLEEADFERAASCDVVFCALPHGASKEAVPRLYKMGAKVIDLSGDFRYNDHRVYEEWYGEPHTAPELLKDSVYGLPELYREKIAKTRLVGNPGCYTTCSILGLAPIVKSGLANLKSIIIDAKSGVSGAGRSTSLDFAYCECDESMKAYKLTNHRHTSEIEQEVSILAGEDVMLSFSPHLIPIKRGILATIYVDLKEAVTTEKLCEIYKDFYKDEFFVRVYDGGSLPEVKNVAGSNFVDIGAVADTRLNRAIIVSCLDNLVKGAAGQAIQNMNIMFGIDERKGLSNAGLYL